MVFISAYAFNWICNAGRFPDKTTLIEIDWCQFHVDWVICVEVKMLFSLCMEKCFNLSFFEVTICSLNGSQMLMLVFD